MENICSSCNESSIVKDISKGILCNCGQIKEYIIDDNPEWRKYNNKNIWKDVQSHLILFTKIIYRVENKT